MGKSGPVPPLVHVDLVEVLAVIQDKLDELWRDVDGLFAEAEKKAAFVKKLRNDPSRPQTVMMTYDTPSDCWQRILEIQRTISYLTSLKVELKYKFWDKPERNRQKARNKLLKELGRKKPTKKQIENLKAQWKR